MNTKVIVAVCLLFLCSHTQAADKSDGERLAAVISTFTEGTKHLDAYDAAYYNIEEDLDQFGDYLSPEQHERGRKLYAAALDSLKDVHSEKLSASDRLTYRLFKEDMEVSLKSYDFPEEITDFNQMGNRLHSYLDDSSATLSSFPFDSVKHYDAFVRRSEGFPAFVDRQIEMLKRGIREKIVLSCWVAEKAIHTYQDGLEKSVEKHPFWRPIGFMPKEFAQKDRDRLSNDFRKMISERIIPGYQKFDRFYREGYLPHCRKSYGVGSYPQGREWYSHRIRESTNLDLDAKKIHEIGLGEVKRISEEMARVKKVAGPKYKDGYFKTADEMFQAFIDVKKKVAEKIPAYFSLTPKSDYKIVASSNPDDAAGSYRQPTELLPYGRFVVNTSNLAAVPVSEVTTLSLHEAVPGHHFQFALKFEMKDKLSEYQRKVFGSTAFEEGWALYSEYLGREMGMYTDPLQRLGNLNDEMLRAVRLVVDTGIHSMGWSRKKVIAYMHSHLGDDLKSIETEADRYSVWPGQALAYKLGQLKIIELRKLAEKELGPGFDIKEFHRVVIGHGTVSLGVLEEQVREWIREVQK